MNRDEFAAECRRQLAEYKDEDGIRSFEIRINKHAALEADIAGKTGFYQDYPDEAIMSYASLWFHSWDLLASDAAKAIPGFSGSSSCMVVRPVSEANSPAWPITEDDDRRICDIFPRRYEYRFEFAEDEPAKHEETVLNTAWLLYAKAAANSADWS